MAPPAPGAAMAPVASHFPVASPLGSPDLSLTLESPLAASTVCVWDTFVTCTAQPQLPARPPVLLSHALSSLLPQASLRPPSLSFLCLSTAHRVRPPVREGPVDFKHHRPSFRAPYVHSAPQTAWHGERGPLH